MSARVWRRITWIYHLSFMMVVIWPVQALVNDAMPLVLGLPRQMAWIAAWVVGSLIVLWRLDRAEAREGRPSDG